MTNAAQQMEFHIRTAQAGDVSALAGFVRAVGFFAHINAEAPETTLERVRRHFGLCAADDSHLVLVAQSAAGEIAGYCAVHWLPYLILAGPEGYVSELFIAEHFRGQGLGSRLLQAAQAEAQQRGCSRLMLINIRKRESYQRQFYPKHGWEERADAANFILPLAGQ